MLKNGLNNLNKVCLWVSLIFLFNIKSPAAERGELSDYFHCGNNDKSRLLAKLVIKDEDQLRPTLKCSSLLSDIAQAKAEEMAAEGKVTHYGIGGSPDDRLRKAGYPLYLPPEALGLNHVEAVQGGHSRAEDVLDNFKNSYDHRVHLFAEHSFFLQQDEIGVGYATEWNSPHVDYWVIYIASRKKKTVK